MAKEYNELIKNYNNVRRYIRDFYIYGLKSRSEYDYKSVRSYDDELRRIISWLDEFVDFNDNSLNGKAYYISVDTRKIRHNPLFNTLKTCSFTDNTIRLNFAILDLLYSPEIKLTLSEIYNSIDVEDESTLRKKLDSFVKEGILIKTKEKRSVYYSRFTDIDFDNTDALDFFSEISPCGVIGSFLLDKFDTSNELFSFKHHFIYSAIDSLVIENILVSISEHKEVIIKPFDKDKKERKSSKVLPLRLYISSKTGRQSLMCFNIDENRIMSYRVDRIEEITIKDKVNPDFDDYINMLDKISDNIWNVAVGIDSNKLEHVEFDISWDSDEEYIYNRLLRESHNKTVIKLSDNSARFICDCYDISELIPWIRTFICRITRISFSDKKLEARFIDDIKRMYSLYNEEAQQ